MKIKLMKKSSLLNMINKMIIILPTPSNISTMWNFGSILGLCLSIQLITGIILSMHYCPNIDSAFNSVSHICRNVNYGWLIRMMHANGASMFFLFLYLHVGRGIYYNSFKLKQTWMIGTTIFLMTMATAFLGYVLPWGQMSFWGATVITNLVSAVPYLGKSIVEWIWGGFAVDNSTLNRFFSFHFALPFIIISMVMIHLMFLHNTGSSNPLGTPMNMDKIPFHPFFTYKDALGILISLLMFLIINLNWPYLLGDPDNFTPANSLVTPIHIQPEWYFLFAYAILRSIPNKLGGVMALLFSILILYLMPMLNKNIMKSSNFYPLGKLFFWILTSNLILLTWIGARPVEEPFILTGQILTITYFSLFFFNYFCMLSWDKFLY